MKWLVSLLRQVVVTFVLTLFVAVAESLRDIQ